MNPFIEYRCSGRQLITFADIKVGDYFILSYEIRRNPIFKYTPVLKKVNETSYEFGGAVMNDLRKVYKTPKVRGTAYSNCGVYKCVPSELDFVVETWLK